MLTQEEVAGLSGRGTGDEVFAQVGGWLEAAEVLLADIGDLEGARSAVLSPLLRWIAARDPERLAAATAFLPEVTEQTLEAFRPDLSGRVPTIEELRELGLLCRDSGGRWFMPELVRNLLQQTCREQDPQQASTLSLAAAQATAGTGSVEQAMETAFESRSWNRIAELMLEHWVDLYIANAQLLGKFMARLPRFLLEQVDAIGVAARIAAGAGPDRMVFLLPSLAPDYDRDETAHRLRRTTERLYRSPGTRALTMGMLELSHLRLAGHFTESGHAGLRLRQALEKATAQNGVRPVLAGFTELQAGISLHLADRLAEARAAFEAAAHWTRGGVSDYVYADACGKLALLAVHEGNMETARHWLGLHEPPLSTVKWGHPMVARAGTLARIELALADLDVAAAREQLALLPAEVDTDEYWCAHARVLALTRTLEGHPDEAAGLVVGWRQERTYSARAPLSDRLLTEAFHLARHVHGENTPVPQWERSPGLANLEALRCLRTGNPDEAASALHRPVRTGRRNIAVAALLRELARTGADPATSDPQVIGSAAEARASGAALADLAGLHQLGWTPALHAGGVLDQDDVDRLDALGLPVTDLTPRPGLTQREQTVLDLLRQGMTRKQMAEATFRSENTIKAQLSSLYAKLGAASAAEALQQARHYGL
ncbi:helix-turn-helix transcriptional regulator [Citricoccus alkalitolerans]|uniref:Response regulator transcription factor n=1 Tax=Citricoccus alkalitolerans TaxID=246603 RepID=A0ABV8XV51_9MICC